MEKDTNEKLRRNYAQQIVEKERAMDQLSKEKKQIQTIFGTLESELTRNFRELEQLNAEVIHKGGKSTRWEQEELSGKQRYLRGFLQQQTHELSQRYTKATAQSNEELLQLQRERSRLSWD